MNDNMWYINLSDLLSKPQEHPGHLRNVVCCGLHEFGPYKHFTVLDMAKQVRSPLLEKLVAMGAKPAVARKR